MPAIWQLRAPGRPREACLASPPANGGVPPAFPPHALPQASSSPGPEVCRPGPRPRQAPGVGQMMPPREMAAWGGRWWLRTTSPTISGATAGRAAPLPSRLGSLFVPRYPRPSLAPLGFAFRATCPPGFLQSPPEKQKWECHRS